MVEDPAVLERSASDLIDGYIGRTAAKTTRMLRASIGRVLFLDEAYQLSPTRTPHSFMGEALDEIVKALTSQELRGKFILILAGYEQDMHELLQQNAGLASRFADHFIFAPFDITASWCILTNKFVELDFEYHGVTGWVPRTMPPALRLSRQS